MRKIDIGLFLVYLKCRVTKNLKLRKVRSSQKKKMMKFSWRMMNRGIDLFDILTTPDGDTVCSALVALVQQVQTQNKILIKILGKLSA